MKVLASEDESASYTFELAAIIRSILISYLLVFTPRQGRHGMARRKVVDNQVAVGNITNISREVNRGACDLIR
jgi:hypothetical protein